jgi:hypothetical protein
VLAVAVALLVLTLPAVLVASLHGVTFPPYTVQSAAGATIIAMKIGFDAVNGKRPTRSILDRLIEGRVKGAIDDDR